jgi:hypothetical protein
LAGIVAAVAEAIASTRRMSFVDVLPREKQIEVIAALVEFVDTVWLVEAAPQYFKTRDPQALSYLRCYSQLQKGRSLNRSSKGCMRDRFLARCGPQSSTELVFGLIQDYRSVVMTEIAVDASRLRRTRSHVTMFSIS